MPRTLSQYGLATKLLILFLLLAPAMALPGWFAAPTDPYVADRDLGGCDSFNGPTEAEEKRQPCDPIPPSPSMASAATATATESEICPVVEVSDAPSSGGVAADWDDCDQSWSSPGGGPSYPTPPSGPGAGAPGGGANGSAIGGGIAPGLGGRPPVSPWAAVSQVPRSSAPLDSRFVDASTGELIWREVDLDLPAIGPRFVLARAYQSGWTSYNGVNGAGWETSLKQHIRVVEAETNGDPTLIAVAQGAAPLKYLRTPFQANGTTWFKVRDAGAYYEYQAPVGGANAQFFAYHPSGTTSRYEELGGDGVYYLMEVSDPFSNTLTYSYLPETHQDLNGVDFPTSHVLVAVTDPQGREIEILWDDVDPLLAGVKVYADAQSTTVLQQVDYHYVTPSGGLRQLDGVEGAKIWTEDQTGAGVWSRIERSYGYDLASGTKLEEVRVGLSAQDPELIRWDYVASDIKIAKEYRGGDASFGVIEYVHDQVDQVLGLTYSQVTTPSGHKRRFYMDLDGQIVRRRDFIDDPDTVSQPRYRETLWEYDNCSCGRVSAIDLPDGMRVEYFYDTSGLTESIWIGGQPDGSGTRDWRVERFEWSAYNPVDSQFYLRMTSHDLIRNAGGEEFPGDECSDPACGGGDPASGHVRHSYTYDSNTGALVEADYGDLQVEAGPPVYSGRKHTFTWHANGILALGSLVIDGVTHATTSFSLSGDGKRVVSRTDSDLLTNDSWTTSYAYDELSRVELVTPPSGVVTKLEYDGRNRPIFVHEDYSAGAGTRTTEYRSDARGAQIASLIYDGAASGSPDAERRLSYDDVGQLLLVEEKLSSSGPLRKVVGFEYDLDGRLIRTLSWQDQNEPAVVEVEIDSATGVLGYPKKVSRVWKGNAETLWEAGDGSGTLDAFDEMGRLLVARDPLGLKRYQSYDAFGRRRRAYHEAEEFKYTASEVKYNTRGFVREIEIGGVEVGSAGGDPRSPSRVWWDQHRKLKVNTAGGTLYSEAYEGLGGVWAAIPSRRREFDRDGLGRVVRVATYHGKKDATGSLAQISYSEYDYDALGRVIQGRQVADPVAGTYLSVTDFYYDEVAATVEALRTVPGAGGFSAKLTTHYDDLGRPVEHVQEEWDDAQGAFSGATRSWETEWDFLDRVLASEDPLGVRSEQVFDAEGRVSSSKRVGSSGQIQETLYSYYASTRTLNTVTDAEGQVTTFYPDTAQFNWPKKTVYPDGRWEEVSYDAFGRVDQISDSRGVVRTLDYGSFGRLEEDLADWGTNPNIVGARRKTWEYDVEAKTVTSRVFSGPLGNDVEVWQTARDYNWIGELVSETQGSGVDALQWGFEAGYGGELRRVDYPAGLGLTKGVFSYLDDGRPVGMEYSDSAVVADYQFAYQGPRLASRTDVTTDIKMEAAFDGWGRLTGVEWAHDAGSGWNLLDGQQRAFDLAGRVIARKRTLDTLGEVFEHDQFGRLEEWYQGVSSALSHTPGSAPANWATVESYDLNKVYRRNSVTKQDFGQSPTTGNYTSTSGAHFYDSVPDGQGGQVGRTQHHGYLSDDSVHRYRYDAWGQLVEVERKSDNAIIREHLYDAEGRRVRTTDEASNVTRLVYWGARLAAQYAESGGSSEILTYGYAGGGDSEAFVVVEGAGAANGTYEIARDLQGSVLALIDRGTGSVVERYRYGAFGDVSIEDGAGTPLAASAFANNRFFLGRPLDETTGHYDIRARWYDPTIGAFVSPDPAGSVDSWNLYQYGFATAGTWRDVTGLSADSQEPAFITLQVDIGRGEGEELTLTHVAPDEKGNFYAFPNAEEGKEIAWEDGELLSGEEAEKASKGWEEHKQQERAARALGARMVAELWMGLVKEVGIEMTVGTAYDACLAVTGVDPRTGEEVEWPERLLVAALLCTGGAGKARNLAKGLRGAKSAGSAAWKLGGNKSPAKWARQMDQRGWTSTQITEALEGGKQFPADNLVNKGNTATRYVHPETGRSVVVDDMTGEVIHVGGDNFRY